MMTSNASPDKEDSSWIASLISLFVGWFPNWAGLMVAIYGLSLYGIPARVFGHWVERSSKH